jgi:tetratricopeptide (TPR) repeat protein
MKKRKSIFFILFVILILGLRGQTSDQLKQTLARATHDTSRCALLNAMIENESDDNVWPKYNEELKSLAEKNLARPVSGTEKKIYLRYLATSLNNLGYLAKLKGDIPLALERMQQSLKLFEESESEKEIAMELNLIGLVYKDQGEIANAIKCFKRSLELNELLGNKEGIASSTNNIGIIYDSQKNYVLALECYKRTLKLHEEMNYKYGTAISLNNIGLVYQNMGKNAEALDHFNRSLRLWEEMGDTWGVGFELDMIGRFYSSQKDWINALKYGRRSFEISRKLGRPEDIRNASGLLHQVYHKLHQYNEALQMYELYIRMRDSINNEETKKASIKSQLNYEYEKKAAQDSIRMVEEKKVSAAQLKAEEIQRYGLYGGLALVALFAAFMVNRLSVASKQKKLIEEQKLMVEDQKREVEQQKHRVEEKQKEILDSIHYARRIQRALITNENYIHRILMKMGVDEKNT